ncbi:nucleotidyltransferase domain-containing protein [Metabacillus idriensis]|uniref:nucleotidyltransferase domain-containing protein n=1 Tax=Metabacillus idriensis TaxID=324768 RepID=UPI00174B1628|nr:nucleotidyltransferase domain-containing protein [Metabacillus idriensis]
MVDHLLSEFDLTKDEVLKIVKTNKKDIVYISGSIVEGYSNQGSDLDVYVIASEPYELIDKSIPCKKLSYGKEYTFLGHQILISALVIEREEFDRLINHVEEKIISNQLIELNNKIVEFYHRVSKGIPLKNDSCFYEIKDRLITESFSKGLSLQRLVYSENRHDDAAGALKSGDEYTAYLSAKISLEKSIDGLLCAEGETNPSDKWLFRRLFSKYELEEDWVTEFVDCYMGNKDYSNIKDRVIEMLRLANRIRVMGYQRYNDLSKISQ